MARATSGGGEVFAEGDLGELSIGGAVVGWVRLHVSRGAVTWERDRWWRLSIDREQWLDIDEWTLDGLGRLRYDRLQGGAGVCLRLHAPGRVPSIGLAVAD